jgi:hypothetical protein
MPHPVNIKNSDCDLYCGRSPNGGVANIGDRGWLGNPIKKGQRCPICGDTHYGNGSTLGCYEDYLRNRLDTDDAFREAFLSKIDEDTRLGCFCKPKPCHTDVIANVWREMQRFTRPGI